MRGRDAPRGARTTEVAGGEQRHAHRPAVERLRLRFRRADAPAAVLVVAMVTVAAVAAGVVVLPGGVVSPLTNRFGTGELLGWSVLALATGGLVFGGRAPAPPPAWSGRRPCSALGRWPVP